MNILLLNGSPRPLGKTEQMIRAFKEGLDRDKHNLTAVDVCRKNIKGCIACEYCHTKGNGQCAQKDDMQEVYEALKKADMLILASPIYYHNLSGQLKCTIDRFYAIGTKENLPNLKKVAMLLASGSPDMYEGALFSLKGDFEDFLGLENVGVFTACGEEEQDLTVSEEKLEEIRAFAKNL